MPGKLIIISSPSGGGKDAVIKALLKIFPNSAKLITTTTRPARREDQNGVTYYFTDKTNFENKIKNNEMIEYNLYANNYYGTEKKELEDKLKKFDLVFSNIDVHGRANFSQAGIKNISIFLMPGSLTDLQKRILGRGGVNEAELQSRLETAKQEIARAKEYDYQVVNENGKLIETIKNVAKIIESNIQTVDILTNSVK